MKKRAVSQCGTEIKPFNSSKVEIWDWVEAV